MPASAVGRAALHPAPGKIANFAGWVECKEYSRLFSC